MSQMPSFFGGSKSMWKMWPSLDAHAPPAEPPDHLLVGNLDQDRRGELPAELGELGVECLALAHQAGGSRRG